MTLVSIPVGTPATERWIYHMIANGTIDGCQLGVDGSVQAGAESFAGRPYYFSDALGMAKAAFSPDGRNAAGQLVEAPVAPYFKTDVLDIMAAGKTLPMPCILGIRSADATWPGHAAIAAWTPGDGSFVDKAVHQWADLLKQVPRYTLCRLWHEHGNGIYGSTDNALFIANWRKIVDGLRALGAVSDTPKSGSVGIIWCPAAHGAKPGDDAKTFPGGKWVHAISRDIYTHPGIGWAESGDAWYATFNPTNGPLNPLHRPLLVSESGIEVGDPERLAKLTELGTRLKGSWKDISGYIWWAGGGNDLTDKPAGFQAEYRRIFSDPYFLPTGIYAGDVVVDPPPPPPPDCSECEADLAAAEGQIVILLDQVATAQGERDAIGRTLDAYKAQVASERTAAAAAVAAIGT
jgi:hypothetical protein